MWRKILVVFGWVAVGALVGSLATLGTMWGYIVEPKVTVGELLSGSLNLLAILALPFIADWLRERHSHQREVIVEWAAEILRGLECAHKLCEEHAAEEGVLQEAIHSQLVALGREIRDAADLVHEAVGKWGYSKHTNGRALAVQAAALRYVEVTDERTLNYDQLGHAREARRNLRSEVIELRRALYS